MPNLDFLDIGGNNIPKNIQIEPEEGRKLTVLY